MLLCLLPCRAIFIPPGPRLGQKVIKVKGLAKSYGDRTLFRGVSFDVDAGSVVGVVRRGNARIVPVGPATYYVLALACEAAICVGRMCTATWEVVTYALGFVMCLEASNCVSLASSSQCASMHGIPPA